MASNDLIDFLISSADEIGVPPELALSLAHAESGLRPNARGPVIKSGMHKGDQAVGMFQLMGATAKELGFDRNDPHENILGGLAYLRQNYDQFGDWSHAVAAYHAGPGAVRKAGGIPNTNDGLSHTRDYVAKIMGNVSREGLADYSVPVEGRQSGQETPEERARANAALEYDNALGLNLDRIAPQQVAAPKNGDGALSRGIAGAKSSARATAALASGDFDTAAKIVSEQEAYRRANPESPEEQKFMDDYRRADGILESLGAVAKNPLGFAKANIAQLPNMVAPMAGMVGLGAAGATAGPVGAVAGGFTGATLGNALVEGGAKISQALHDAGINPNDTAAVSDFIRANQGDILTKTGIKAGVIGAVDTATMGIAGAWLKAPARAAAQANERLLTGMGVNLTDKAAVSAAMRTPTYIAGREAIDGAYKAATTGATNFFRNAGVAAMEPAGEFGGEYFGEGLSTGDYNASEAGLEALMAMGSSAATFAGQKAYQLATQKTLDAIEQQEQIQQASQVAQETLATAPDVDTAVNAFRQADELGTAAMRLNAAPVDQTDLLSAVNQATQESPLVTEPIPLATQTTQANDAQVGAEQATAPAGEVSAPVVRDDRTTAPVQQTAAVSSAVTPTLTAPAQPTTTQPIEQKPTALTIPQNKTIESLRQQMEATEPFTRESSVLQERLQLAVTADAVRSIRNGSMPVYQVSQNSFVTISPSAQNAGKVQVTRYNNKGVFGDSQYNTIEEAIRSEGLWVNPRLSEADATALLQQSLNAEAEFQSKQSDPVQEAAKQPATKQQSAVKSDRSGLASRDDLVGAIMRVTGNKGISADMAQTITGGKAGSDNPKLRGLFLKGGTMDLGDVAELLRVQENFDVRDGDHLSELIRNASAGDVATSMGRTEDDAAANEEAKRKDYYLKRAAELGLKGVGGRRKLEHVVAQVDAKEAEIAAKEKEIGELEAREERAAIQAAEIAEDIYQEGAELTEADLMAWLGDRIEYSQDEINEANTRASERESRRTEANAYDDTEEQAQGSGTEGAGTGATEAGARSTESLTEPTDDLINRAKALGMKTVGVSAEKLTKQVEEAESFNLSKQTNEQAAAEYKRQQEEANKKDEEPAAPDVKADQVDMWNTQGSLIDNNREPSQSQQKSDAAPESAQDKAPAITADNDSVATVESHSDFMERLNDGGITIDEFMAHFESVKNSKSGLVEELGKKTKLELLRLIGGYSADRYKNDKKDQVVSVAYRSMLDDFVLGDNISYGIGAKYEDVIGGYVSRYTQEDLRAYADKIKSRREERQAQREDVAKAIAGPKTVVDFDTLLRAKKSQGMTFAEARMSLTPEQRAEYDRIKGIESRDQRKARADQQKTDIRVASQTTEGQVVETKHTKTGEPLFVVKAAERVDRDVYTQWNNTAKRIGGYYSSFRGNGAVPGFQFKTRENADAFLNFIGGNAESAKEAVQERRDAFADDRSQSAVERLNEMAERLEEKADQSLGRERKENTERRARFAASAESAANAEKAMAKTMRRIADAIDNGTAQFLDRVRQKSQIEYLTSVLRTAKDSELRSKYPSYAEQEKHKGEPATGETADYAEFPQYAMMRSDLANLARKMVTLPNMKMLGQRILKVADDTSAAYTAFAKEHLMEVSRFGKADGSGLATFSTMKDAERSIDVSNLAAVAVPLQIKRGEYRIVLSPSEAINRGIWKGDDRKIFLSPDVGEEIVEKLGKLNRRNGKHRGIDAPPEAPWQFENAYNSRKRLAGMGIEQPWEFRAALREFANLKEAPKEADKIKAQERSMIGRKNDGLDFFPTPVGTAQEMVNAAELKDGMSVLEPSAGMGHIAEQIRESGVEPDVVEFNGDRRELLELKGFNVVGFDFMDVAKSYDRIIMNPPFSNRRDAEHVQHAYSLLKPGGRIVAIMGEGVFFGQDKKAQDFREWLDGVGGTSEKLADGTFLDPSLPVNTGTNARMVVINKPADALYSKGDETVSAPMQQSAAEQRIKSLLGNKVGRLLIESGIITFTNKGNAYQGATYTNGTIALNLDALSADNFDGVLLHEGFHSTIKQLVGEETYAKLMKQLENMLAMGRGAQWVKDANAAVPDDTKPENVTEEIAAYAIEQHKNGGKIPSVLQRWVQSFLSAIRTAIIKHLPNGKLKMWAIANVTPQDLSNLALAGLKAKAAGQVQAQGREAMAYSTAFGKESQHRTPIGDATEIEVDGIKRPTMNSNGMPIHWSREGVENFWLWFGDSKVVDDQGRPMVVYHGTRRNFDVFISSYPRGAVGNQKGVYFTADKSGAEEYAQDNDGAWDDKSRVISAYIKIESDADGKAIDSAYRGREYVVFKPENIKSTGNNGDFDGANPDIRYSRAPAQQPQPAPLPEETKARKAQRLGQDKFNRFTVIKDWLAEHGVALSEQADVYKAEERMHSRFANQVEDFRNKLVEPLIKKIQAAGFSMDDVSMFLHAQHAEERNNQIAKINPKVTDGSGMTTADANNVLSAAPAELRALANEFRQITEMTKQTLLTSGIISQDMVDAWEGAYSNYIPLKGGPDGAKAGTGKGLHVNGKMKRALGHGKREGGEWIVENILADYERAVMLAEKNRVGQHLIKMALEVGRDDVIALNKPEKRAVLRNSHAYEVRYNGSLVAVFDSETAAKTFKTTLGKAGVTITKTNDPSVIYSASPMLQDNEANVYVNGHAIRVQINDDLLAQAYKNLGAEPLNAILSAGRMLNGYLSKAYTGYNPEFILTNIVRDFTTGLINITGEEGAMFAAKSAKNYLSSFGQMLKYAVTGNETQWIKDYRADGGNTGAAYLSDLERLGKEIKTEYASYKGVLEHLKEKDGAGAARAAGRNLFNWTLKWIEHLNQAGENAMRLSIYRTAIESGKTRAEAASLAKNSTVNFNRKGELGAQANALYLFFNAGVQGTSALAHAHFKGKHKYQAWALSSGMIALGYLMASAFGGGDEDDYDRELSDYDKSRNLVIRAGDSWVKIPVPYGYGFFYNLGRHFADSERKGEWDKMPWHLASDFVGEFTPFSGVVAGKEPDVRQSIYALPTAFQIPGAVAVNRTGMGSPIFPDSAFDPNRPDNLKMWRNTKGSLSDDMAQALAKAGLEVSPETLKYLGRTATGGSGAFVGAVADAGKLTAEGADLETKEMPFVRKFVKEGSVSDYRAAYYEAKSEASKAADDLSRAKKMGDMMSAKKLMEDNGELIAMDKYADKLSKTIKAKRDMQDVIKQNDNLTIAEKRMKLKAMEIEEQKLYDKYLDIYKQKTQQRKDRLDKAA